MKNMLLLLSVLAAGTSRAQLGTLQVYDFSPGDVLQCTISAGWMDTVTIRTDIILSEYVDSTYNYAIKRTEYTPATQTSPPIYTESIVTLAIDDLTETAQHYTYASCLPTVSSEFSGSCGDATWRLESATDSSCADAPVWHSELRSGLGGPYYYTYDPAGGPDNWYEIALTYANTAWLGECGSFFSTLDTGEAIAEQLLLFPNPAGDVVTIEAPFSVGSYTIISPLGTIVSAGAVTGMITNLDVSPMQPGYYTICIATGGTSIVRSLVIE